MTLREARCKFTSLKPFLVNKALSLGYEIADGEGMDRKTVKDPTSDHMEGSLHDLGLAQDYDLYREGKYICHEGKKCEHSNTHLPFDPGHDSLGIYWESLHPDCRWGGRFADPNHYSFAPVELVGNRK